MGYGNGDKTTKFIMFSVFFIIGALIALHLFSLANKPKNAESGFWYGGRRRPYGRYGYPYWGGYGYGYPYRYWGYPYNYSLYDYPIIADTTTDCYKNVEVKTEGYGTRNLCLTKDEYIAKLRKDLSALRGNLSDAQAKKDNSIIGKINNKINAVLDELRVEGV